VHRLEYDALDMAEPYVQEYRARWADMDFNQHMRNAAYLGVAEETRMRFLEENGWTMAEFARRRLGPVVVEDRLTYRKELGLLEPFRVDLALSASTDDTRKFRVRNRFFRTADGALCATVDSVVLWFDLEQRRTIVPPPDLARVWLSLPRSDDFARLEG
jgi:acyl-CoA thioester hydrolase